MRGTSAISPPRVTASTTGSSSNTSRDAALRGLFDRLIVRRAVAGAMGRTVENLERELPDG